VLKRTSCGCTNGSEFASVGWSYAKTDPRPAGAKGNDRLYSGYRDPRLFPSPQKLDKLGMRRLASTRSSWYFNNVESPGEEEHSRRPGEATKVLMSPGWITNAPVLGAWPMGDEASNWNIVTCHIIRTTAKQFGQSIASFQGSFRARSLTCTAPFRPCRALCSYSVGKILRRLWAAGMVRQGCARTVRARDPLHTAGRKANVWMPVKQSRILGANGYIK